MTVGDRIRNKRIELGYTQVDLAKKMGYSGKSVISKAETCGDNITTSKVEKYAKALNVSVAYLMGWEDNLTQENAKTLVDFLVSEDEMRILTQFQALSPENKKLVMNLIEQLNKNL